MSGLEQFDGCFPIWTFCKVSIIPLCLFCVMRRGWHQVACVVLTHPYPC